MNPVIGRSRRLGAQSHLIGLPKMPVGTNADRRQ
jgi:hypothetical protein